MNTLEITTKLKEYSSITELSTQNQSLCKESLDAAKSAYAPYSQFYVGAAVLLDNGKIITGNNQENIAFPSGLCAERVALFYANAQFPKNAIVALAITAIHNNEQIDEPITPCGSCRQVIAEIQNKFNKEIVLILWAKKRVFVIDNAADLLPFGFNFLKLPNHH